MEIEVGLHHQGAVAPLPFLFGIDERSPGWISFTDGIYSPKRDERLHHIPPGIGRHDLLTVGLVDIAALVESQISKVFVQRFITDRLANVAQRQQ